MPERPSRPATLLLLIGGGITGIVGLIGLAAVVLSERVTPDLVSGRFAFLTGSCAIAAAVAGAFLIWVRLASGERPAAGTAPAPARRPVRRAVRNPVRSPARRPARRPKRGQK